MFKCYALEMENGNASVYHLQDSSRFAKNIEKALDDIRKLFEKGMKPIDGLIKNANGVGKVKLDGSVDA